VPVIEPDSGRCAHFISPTILLSKNKDEDLLRNNRAVASLDQKFYQNYPGPQQKMILKIIEKEAPINPWILFF
jgi:hypothetical protein